MGKMVLRYFQWNLRILRVKNPKLEIRSPKEIRNPKSEFPLAPWNNIGTWTQVIRTAYSTGRAIGAGDRLYGSGTGVAWRNKGFEIRANTDSPCGIEAGIPRGEGASDFELRISDFLQASSGSTYNSEEASLIDNPPPTLPMRGTIQGGGIRKLRFR